MKGHSIRYRAWRILCHLMLLSFHHTIELAVRSLIDILMLAKRNHDIRSSSCPAFGLFHICKFTTLIQSNHELLWSLLSLLSTSMSCIDWIFQYYFRNSHSIFHVRKIDDYQWSRGPISLSGFSFIFHFAYFEQEQIFITFTGFSR